MPAPPSICIACGPVSLETRQLVPSGVQNAVSGDAWGGGASGGCRNGGQKIGFCSPYLLTWVQPISDQRTTTDVLSEAASQDRLPTDNGQRHKLFDLLRM